MKYCTIALTAALTLLATSISAEERYLCEAFTAGGVTYNTTSKEWVGMRFADDGKYIISKPAIGEMWEEKSFVITKIGDNIPSGYCTEPFSTNGYLNCNKYGDFIFNKNTLRFMSFYSAGYLDGMDNNDNTPHVSIGKCSPF